MNRMRVALFSNLAEAEPLRRRLEQNGVPVQIHYELGLARLWFVTKRAAGVRLEVPVDQWERATQFLLKWEAEQDGLRNAIRCPECGSLLVDYPQFTQKSFFTNLAIGLIAELGLIEKDYYCEHCHCMWPKQRTKPWRARLHMAPNYFLEDLEDGTATLPRDPSPDAPAPPSQSSRLGA